MQTKLFHERIEEAIDEVCRACGGRKVIAMELFGKEKSQRDAHNALDAMLNPERREKFSPSQLVYIAQRGQEVGCHSIMAFLGQECGYELKPITKAAEVDRLTTVVEQSTKTLASALATLERLQRGA